MTTRTPYPSYKPSGIDWLGDIPSHWNVRRVQHLAHLNMASLPENTESSYQFEYVDIGAVGTGVLVEEPEQVQFGDSPSRARRIVKSGDTILSTVRTYLKAVYHFDNVSSPVIVSTGFTTLTPKQAANSRFMKWAVVSDGFVSEVESQSTGVSYPAINETKVAKLPLPLPPLEEQRAIADYLDRKDAQITRFIESRRRMIALLEEKKQAIINQAVTKGLDPSVPMKDSGVEWLGEIPVHWEVRPNRFLMRPRRKLVGSLADDYTLLSLTLNGVIERDMVNPEGKFPASFDTYQEVVKGDLIFCLFDIEETPRCVGLSSYDGMITGAYDVLRPIDSGKSEFIYRYYLAIDQRKALKPAYKGLRNTIRVGHFLSFGTPVPPEDEMKEIIDHIEGVEDQVNRAITLHKQEIDLIQEYRTRLISDVVTGKVRVS